MAHRDLISRSHDRVSILRLGASDSENPGIKVEHARIIVCPGLARLKRFRPRLRHRLFS